MPYDVLNNTGLQGQSRAGAEKIFASKDWQDFWKGLTKKQQRRATKDSIFSVSEINAFIKAAKDASKALEEYNGKIEKYQSTFKKLTSAYKEGREQTRLYLEEAARSGGKLAVFGAAVSLVTKQLKEQIDGMQDYVNSVRRYDVEQEKFSRSALTNKKSLDNMRWSLSLTKNEMAAFFDEIKKGETMGFNTAQMEIAMKKLRTTYGNDAMKMFSGYQDILEKMPNVSGQIKSGKGFQGFSQGDVYNLMANDKMGQVMQLRGAGLFGGEAEKSKAADIENVQKLMDSFGEFAKDEASRFFIPSLSLFSKMSGGITELAGISANILTIVGSIRTAMAVKGGQELLGKLR